jgi:hypothetical protein
MPDPKLSAAVDRVRAGPPPSASVDRPCAGISGLGMAGIWATAGDI